MRASAAHAPPAQERWAARGCRRVQGTAGSPALPGACAAGSRCPRFQVLGKLKKADDKKMKEACTGGLEQSPDISSTYSL